MPRKQTPGRVIDRTPTGQSGLTTSVGSGSALIAPTSALYLRADGGQALLGNLPVAAGVTLDGVDLSAHAADPNAHHLAFTGLTATTGNAAPSSGAISVLGGAGLTTSASGSTLTLTPVAPATLSVSSPNSASAGTHAITSSSNPGAAASLLATSSTGGLTLDTTLLVVDATQNRVGIGMTPSAARLDVTGAGSEAALKLQGANTTTSLVELLASSLTSGSLMKATLPADRPVLEARGSGDTQPRLQLLSTGLLFGSGSATPDVGLRRGGAQHLIVDDNGLGGAVDLSVSRKITAGSTTPGAAMLTSTWTGGAQLRLGYDTSNYMDFLIDNGGNWTINPTGDIIVDPLGNDMRPQTNYDINLGLINKKWLSLHAAELWVETLVAQNTIATIGGRILVGPTTTLTTDLSTAGGSGTTTPPTFVAGGALVVASATTSVSQTPPVGTASGHLMLAEVVSRADGQTFTTPSGWTLIGTWRDTSTTPDTDVALFWRIAGASETSPYTFSVSASATLGVTLTAWSGVDTAAPLHAFAGQANASSNTITAPSVTTTVANTTLILIAAGATTKLITPPASMTERWELSGGTSTVNGYGADEAFTSAGATGTRVATYTDASARASIGVLVALAPTPATGGGSTIIVKHNQMQNGDTVYMEANGKVEFMRIASAASGSGPYTYTVTRDLDGTGANDWYAGDALFNTGQAGNGFIDLYSLRGIKSASQAGPTIVGNVRTSATYNDWAEHWAIGNLNGLYDYGATVYGFAAGKYTGAGGTTPWLSVDATNGIRMMRGSTKLGQWATDGTITVGRVAAGAGNVLLDSGGVRLRTNTVVKLDAQTDGDLLIGTNTTAPSTTFLSLFSVAQTSNGESMAAGDVLLGDNSANKPNLKWIPASGRLDFRGGTTTTLYLNSAGQLVVGADLVVADAAGLRLKTWADTDPVTYHQLYWSTANSATVKSASIGARAGTTSISLELTAGGSQDAARAGFLSLTTWTNTTKTGALSIGPAGIGLTTKDGTDAAAPITLIAKAIDLYTGSVAFGSPVPGLIKLRGGVQIGNTLLFDPTSSWGLSVQGAIVAGGYMHPGNQTTMGFATYSAPYGLPNALYANGNLYTNGYMLSENWFRSTGATGWYSQTYGGGLYQTATGYIETYGTTGFKSNGTVGIRVVPIYNHGLTIDGTGTTSGSYGLVVRDSASNNRLYVRDDGLGNWVSTNWNVGSDAKFKQAIRGVDSARLDKARGIPAKLWENAGGETRLGYVAQDIQPLMADVVTTDMHGDLAVNYVEVLVAKVAALEAIVYGKGKTS